MNDWRTSERQVSADVETLSTRPDIPAASATETGSGPQDPDNPLLLNGAAFDVSQEVGFLLRRVQQRVTSLFQQRMKDYDLTPTQFASLCKMAEIEEVSQNHLGRLVNLDPATNQGVVRRLIKRGLICRRDDPNDRRRSLLSLTDQGRELLVECLPTASRVTPAVLGPLSPDERVEIVRLLKKLG